MALARSASTTSCPNDSASRAESHEQERDRLGRREQPGDDHREGHALDRRPRPCASSAAGPGPAATARPARPASSAYRADPIASTHQPTTGPAATLRTRMRNASASMSNRAPSGVTDPRPAGHPAVDRVEGEGERGQRHSARCGGRAPRRTRRPARRPPGPGWRGPGSPRWPARTGSSRCGAGRRPAGPRRWSPRPDRRPSRRAEADGGLNGSEQRDDQDQAADRCPLNRAHETSVYRSTQDASGAGRSPSPHPQGRRTGVAGSPTGYIHHQRSITAEGGRGHA